MLSSSIFHELVDIVGAVENLNHVLLRFLPQSDGFIVCLRTLSLALKFVEAHPHFFRAVLVGLE